MCGYELPALVCLALDGGLAGLSLGIEGVEGEIEVMLGGFAGVDRAALDLWRRAFLHGPAPRLARAADRSWPSVRPKKRQPFQRVPVISLAMAERLGKVRPSQEKPPSTTKTSWRAPAYSRTMTDQVLIRRGGSA